MCTDLYVQCTYGPVHTVYIRECEQKHIHNVVTGMCVSDYFEDLGEHLSEPKPNVIRIFDFGTGCEPEPYVQCTFNVRP